MSEDADSTSNKVNAVANLAKAIPVYDDALKPLAVETGKALSLVGRTVNVALAPVKGMVWGAEQVEKWIAKSVASKLENEASEEIVTPDIAIAGPTIEALRFSGQKPELSELFAGLLSSAMLKSKKDQVHPSFVGLITAMNSSDARLLAAFSQEPTVHPFIEVGMKEADGKGKTVLWRYYAPQLLELLYGDSIQSLTKLAVSIDNLSRMGLIEPNRDSWLSSDHFMTKYAEFEDTLLYSEARKKCEAIGKSLDAKKGFLELTDLGKAFVNVCIIE